MLAGSTPAYTTEVYDGFGRRERMCEGQPTAWAGNCDGFETVYSYDESGNLAHVGSAATESGCGQERFFTRDNRGFLVRERQPEIGPSGNGWTSYTYDVMVTSSARPSPGPRRSTCASPTIRRAV